MMRHLLLASVFLLAGCGPTPEEQAAQDAQAVAEVRANQVPPPERVEPEPILYPDIEEHELFGAGCNFVPEGGGLGAIAIAQEDRGYMKRGGEVLTFAADKGSARQPLGSYRKYDGRLFGFTLELTGDAGEQEGIETVNIPANLTVRDGRGRTVFAAPGIAQCGS